MVFQSESWFISQIFLSVRKLVCQPESFLSIRKFFVNQKDFLSVSEAEAILRKVKIQDLKIAIQSRH